MYLLSVIIPTKNRYEYLKECLQTLVDINCDILEIVVQDNTLDNSDIVNFINHLSWKHIKYFHDTSVLSQTENSDLALSHATGEYCTYIGDDDSLCVAALDAAKYLKKHNIVACVNDMATYHWPDVVYQGKEQPALSFDKRPCLIKELNSDKVLKSFLSWGCQDITYLPRIYHGIIRHDILEQIKTITGSYFPGPSPDMSNAVAAVLLINKYIYIRQPLIISGYSYKSAGGMGLRGAHVGGLKDAKQLPKSAEVEWSSKIPKVWLGYTVWAESSEKAFIRMKEEDYLTEINYSAMHAKTFLKYSSYRRIVINFNKGFVNKLALLFECIRFMIRWSFERFNLFVRSIGKMQYKEFERISLTQACNIVNSFYIEHKIIE